MARMNYTGRSSVSLMDAGIGAVAGIGVPMATKALLDRYAPASWSSVADYHAELGGVAGLLLAIPMYYWRGMGLAVITAACAVIYGGGSLVGRYLGDALPEAAVTDPAVGRLAGRRRRLAALTAGRRTGSLTADARPLAAVRSRVQGAGY